MTDFRKIEYQNDLQWFEQKNLKFVMVNFDKASIDRQGFSDKNVIKLVGVQMLHQSSPSFGRRGKAA
jgi:hypothetical protein